MAISLKAAGTWARNVSDPTGAITIPGSPAAGDRMFLFAAWKDYSITTATISGWTAIGTEYADGTTAQGNGVGSVKVMAWYRDWQSGDSGPSINWSSAPNEAHVVIQLWQKGSGESWDAPTTVTGPMTNWTTTSQTFSASASTTIPNNSVVMGLVALRDDSATMTRPTTGISNSAGSVTWNGDYVESPATHFNSTTGNDMAGDLGHRFVTTGGAGVTLSMTGTISAAETGAGKWVIQGVTVNPSFTQASYRFYEDGTESGSTAIDAQDTNITEDVSSGDQNLQLRIRVQETAGGAGVSTDDYQLQYEVSDSGTYLPVGTLSAVDDPDSEWGSDANAFDGSTATSAFTNTGNTGTTTSRHLVGRGTTAPSSGGTITQVRARVYAANTDGPTTNAAIFTRQARELLGTATNTSASPAWGSYTTLSAPNAGWTWAALQLLEVRLYQTAGSFSQIAVYRVEIEVTHSSTETFYFDGSDSSSAIATGHASANLTDGNATTNRLGSGTGSFVAGKISEDGLVDNLQITASNYTELLYSLTIDSDAVADNDTLDFRVLRNGAVLNTYTVTPRITIEEGAGGATLVMQDALSGTSADAVVLTQAHTLAVQDAGSGSSADNAVLVQDHLLAPADVALATTSDNAVLVQDQVLVVQDATSTTTADAIVLTQAHALTLADSAVASTADNVALTQAHTLAVDDASVATTADNTTLTTDTPLVIADASSATTADAVAVTQLHNLALEDAGVATSADNVVLVATIELVVADATTSTSADNVLITQAHTIVVDDSALSTTSDNAVLTQAQALTVQDALSATSTENVNITQAHVLTTADATASTIADNVDLTQAHTLALDDSAVSTSSDNAVLSTTVPIEPQDATSSTTSDHIALIQAHTLAVDDALLASTADNAVLTQGQILVVEDVTSATTADNVVLVQDHVLSVGDSLTSTSAENVDLSQSQLLAVDDALSATSSDNAELVGDIALTVQDATSSTSVDGVTMTQDSLLIISDVELPTTAESLVLTQFHQLLVDDASVATRADSTFAWDAYWAPGAVTPSTVTAGNIPSTVSFAPGGVANATISPASEAESVTIDAGDDISSTIWVAGDED